MFRYSGQSIKPVVRKVFISTGILIASHQEISRLRIEIVIESTHAGRKSLGRQSHGRILVFASAAAGPYFSRQSHSIFLQKLPDQVAILQRFASQCTTCILISFCHSRSRRQSRCLVLKLSEGIVRELFDEIFPFDCLLCANETIQMVIIICARITAGRYG